MQKGTVDVTSLRGALIGVGGPLVRGAPSPYLSS
jgi:hypothetical protein